MRLQEEYIKRHNLQYKPIYYAREANLILRIRGRPQVVLNIQWEDRSTNPGFYVFDFLNPTHNGYLDGNYLLGEKKYHQYDEYASYITRWVRHLEFEPVKSSEVKLAVWEMFLYCFDGWIAEHSLEELAFRATDPCLSNEERCEGVDAFLYHLESFDSIVFDIYNVEFRKYEYHYANWLVELIELQQKEAKDART